MYIKLWIFFGALYPICGSQNHDNYLYNVSPSSKVLMELIELVLQPFPQTLLHAVSEPKEREMNEFQEAFLLLCNAHLSQTTAVWLKSMMNYWNQDIMFSREHYRRSSLLICNNNVLYRVNLKINFAGIYSERVVCLFEFMRKHNAIFFPWINLLLFKCMRSELINKIDKKYL